MATRDTQQCQTRNSLKALEQHAMQCIINRNHACRIRKKKALNRALQTPSASESSRMFHVSWFRKVRRQHKEHAYIKHAVINVMKYIHTLKTQKEPVTSTPYAKKHRNNQEYTFLNKFTLTHTHTHLAETQSCKKWAQGKEINLKWRRHWCD